MILDAWGWCTGTTQRDGMGRDEGGGFRMGTEDPLEEDGNPLQYSCLENPRDGGAWWAAVYGVAQSWTRLK